ncbi:MAG: ABC transporter permease [Sphaerochaetaceae bacterium]|nr:ABC transporter permease [Sphaerochaetaceae bacterium]
MNLNMRMLRNDFRRNRGINLSLLLFMALATGLVVASSVVVTQLFTSMTEMYRIAAPPHFLQMHIGPLNQRDIDDFNAGYPGLVAAQTVPMIDVHGEDLTVIGSGPNAGNVFDLSDCRLDIGLVRQNSERDLLLDADRRPVALAAGEIGVPVILLDAYDVAIGDTVILERDGVRRTFTVAEFVHDAQMNSTLCSSTRLLLSDADFLELVGGIGETEYLVEAYFTDTSLALGYRTAYENAGLPQNGQAVTYTMIFLLSAFTDIMLAIVFLTVSLLLVLVALLCIKYTLLASLEEEVGEIGTMKAIGLSDRDIGGLYRGKIHLLVLIGICLGYIVALLLSDIVIRHVAVTFGNQPMSPLTVSVPLLVCVLLFLIADRHCGKALKRLRRLTVVDALVTGKGFDGERRGKNCVRDGLSAVKHLPVGLAVSLREVCLNARSFAIVFSVTLIVSIILIVPMNLLHTMGAKEFVSYMGSPSCDLLVELEPGAELGLRYSTVRALLAEASPATTVEEFKRVRVSTETTAGRAVVVHVDCGPSAGNELRYLVGNAPRSEEAIALSALNADALGVSVGEQLHLWWENHDKVFVVSGIYQDVTSGGYTAKSLYGFEPAPAEKYSFAVKLPKSADPKATADRWRAVLGGGYTIEPMEEFLEQTLGGVTRQVRSAVFVAVAVGLCVSALIILLFMKLRLAKDVSQISILKAVGFSNSDIRRQYLYKVGLVSLAGVLCGSLFANLLGDNLASVVFASMNLGISKIAFIVNPWTAFLLLPSLLFAVSLSATWLCTGQVKGHHVVSLINE